jgi:hypothetical protein
MSMLLSSPLTHPITAFLKQISPLVVTDISVVMGVFLYMRHRIGDPRPLGILEHGEHCSSHSSINVDAAILMLRFTMTTH